MMTVYAVHGEGTDDLWTGLSAINMPTSRQPHAVEAVRQILEANHATGVTWYKVPGTEELTFRWDGCTRNSMWVQKSNVHVLPGVAFPLTVTRHSVHGQPMHHFPGATSMPEGRRGARQQTPTPLPCQRCFNPHPPDTECEDW